MAEATNDPDPPVWNADYTNRITASDVLAMLGHAPRSRADFVRTRDLMAEADSRAAVAEWTALMLGGASDSVLINRELLRRRTES